MEKWVRGKVAGVRLADDGTFVANASALTLLSLENLELGPDLGDDFAAKIPTSLTEMYLRNNALETFSLSSLPNLRILYGWACPSYTLARQLLMLNDDAGVSRRIT